MIPEKADTQFLSILLSRPLSVDNIQVTDQSGQYKIKYWMTLSIKKKLMKLIKLS